MFLSETGWPRTADWRRRYKGGQSWWKTWQGSPTKTQSPLTKDFRSHSKSSVHLCIRAPPALEMPFARWNRRHRKPSYRSSSRAWKREQQVERSHTYLWNRWYWSSLIWRRRPLRTGRRPVWSQETSSQRSGARRSSERRTTPRASEREGLRCGSGLLWWKRRPRWIP